MAHDALWVLVSILLLVEKRFPLVRVTTITPRQKTAANKTHKIRPFLTYAPQLEACVHGRNLFSAFVRSKMYAVRPF